MENYKPHIGKNVIETLTLGMYENSLFIYREYVQNAADQIDIAVEEDILNKKSDGQINIRINKEGKIISIEDNATGIKSSEVLQFLGDVANSQKDKNKRKGFRGIGRLGGLGYCEKLIFETTYKGEATKSIITLNAKQLKNIIEDSFVTMDAATVISAITSLEKKEEELSKHYFKVSLINVTNNELLKEKKVRDYLSMVAPVSFHNNFKFSKKIHQYFNDKNVKIEEYDIFLNINERKLYKAYKTNIFKKEKIVSTIKDIDFFEFRNEDNELIAIAWYGISDLLNFIIRPENIERGIRIRKDNIQIGDEDTLNRFFNEDRFNHHFIGEIHVIGNNFIPNARRDYFNDNKTIQLFEQKLKEQTNKLSRLAHDSSIINNRKKELIEYIEEEKKFKIKKFRSANEKKHFEKDLEEKKRKAEKAKNILKKYKKKSNNQKALKIIYEAVVNDKILENKFNKNNFSNTEYKFKEPLFSKLKQEQKIIVEEIFLILEKNLSIEDAEKIKQIIIGRYR